MKIEIEIPDDQVVLINRFLRATQNGEFNSHGPLTMKILAEMLLEDVALMVRRPGSWEGAGMGHLLSSHGYV